MWLSVVPVVVYSNADVLKKIILKENKDKSGIYRWTNLINNKSYLGRSTCLDKRFRCYFNVLFLENTNMLIYKALLKYGYSNFKLEILMMVN